MQTSSSKTRVQLAPRSASEHTPTGAIPRVRQARAMRTATSPRLATSKRWNMRQSLPYARRSSLSSAPAARVALLEPGERAAGPHTASPMLATLLLAAPLNAADEFTDQL